jgi:hypothetical protein
MRYILPLILLFFLSGCSYTFLSPKIEASKSATILIKTSKLRYFDSGFVNQKNSDIEIKAFSTGVEVLDIDINSHICLNSVCYKKEVFNRDYLSIHYPNDTLKMIFTSKPIFDKKSLKPTKDGFIQQIKTKSVDIKYEVSKDKVYFKDYQNRVLIKINYLPTANK